MKFFSLGVCLLLSFQLTAQSERDSINRDVWYNFMQAYQDLDASLFNQIHSDDVLRVSVDNNSILVGQEYKDRNLENFNRWNLANVKQRIEFSFSSRVAKGEWAYETGIYKLTRYGTDGNKSFYGKFHVTLKKIKGYWKIMIDSDTNEGGTITEDDFLSGEILR